MSNSEHTITPPPELVQQWRDDWVDQSDRSGLWVGEYIATQASRWGADQELEACIEAVLAHPGFESPELFVELLRSARRPQPPSLKERALSEVAGAVAGGNITPERGALIRLALEQLDD